MHEMELEVVVQADLTGTQTPKHQQERPLKMARRQGLCTPCFVARAPSSTGEQGLRNGNRDKEKKKSGNAAPKGVDSFRSTSLRQGWSSRSNNGDQPQVQCSLLTTTKQFRSPTSLTKVGYLKAQVTL